MAIVAVVSSSLNLATSSLAYTIENRMSLDLSFQATLQLSKSGSFVLLAKVTSFVVSSSLVCCCCYVVMSDVYFIYNVDLSLTPLFVIAAAAAPLPHQHQHHHHSLYYGD